MNDLLDPMDDPLIDPQDPLDQYQQDFEGQNQMMERGFDGHDVIHRDGLDMVENHIEKDSPQFDFEQGMQERQDFSARIVEDRADREEGEVIEEYFNSPQVEIPGPLPDDKFKRMGSPSETLPGVLGKADKRDAPYDPTKWSPSAGIRTHPRPGGLDSFLRTKPSKGSTAPSLRDKRYCEKDREFVRKTQCEEKCRHWDKEIQYCKWFAS